MNEHGQYIFDCAITGLGVVLYIWLWRLNDNIAQLRRMIIFHLYPATPRTIVIDPTKENMNGKD